MATRTSDLTEFAKPVADRLAARCGSLKKVLSAAVLAFDTLQPDQRELFMAMAEGQTAQSEAVVLDVVRPVVEELVRGARDDAAKQRRKTGRKTSKAG